MNKLVCTGCGHANPDDDEPLISSAYPCCCCRRSPTAELLDHHVPIDEEKAEREEAMDAKVITDTRPHAAPDTGGETPGEGRKCFIACASCTQRGKCAYELRSVS